LNLSNWLGLRSFSLAEVKVFASCLRISTLSYYLPSNKHIDTGHVFFDIEGYYTSRNAVWLHSKSSCLLSFIFVDQSGVSFHADKNRRRTWSIE